MTVSPVFNALALCFDSGQVKSDVQSLEGSMFMSTMDVLTGGKDWENSNRAGDLQRLGIMKESAFYFTFMLRGNANQI